MSKQHVKQPLLCKDCEQRFDQNGETHVLDVIAPKNTKVFALHERMRVALARDSDPMLRRFYGPDFGLDLDKFAYFAVSVVWRLCAAQWPMQDGALTRERNLGDFQERMRRFLLGEIPFPSGMAVIIIVCSDLASRQRFFQPDDFDQAGCINMRFLARGIFFRTMFGYIPRPFREMSCTEALRCVFYGDCERRTMEGFSKRPGTSPATSAEPTSGAD